MRPRAGATTSTGTSSWTRPSDLESAHIVAVQPHLAIPRGRVDIVGQRFAVGRGGIPAVWIADRRARPVSASPSRLSVCVPVDVDGGPLPVRVEGAEGETAILDVAAALATGLHQVDSPALDAAGNLFVTYSGTRGQQVPVSIFKVRPDGTRETYSSGVVNPTSMAIGPDGRLYVSSRFEGAVYRLDEEGAAERFASDLGVACGLAFAPDGSLYVGDRSGTVFRVDPEGRASRVATLPSSVAAFHLALRADGTLFVSAPTLASQDPLYEIDPSGSVRVRAERFGRPQGMTFDASGALLIVEALAGLSGLYRVADSGAPELVLAGPGLVGVALDAHAGLVVCSNDTAYRLGPPA